MDEYIKQLVELIEQAINKTKSNKGNLKDMDNDYIDEFADQYINGVPEQISKITGIDKYQFPSVDQLNTTQINTLLNSLEELLLSYNWEFVFPEDVTDDIKYGFITGKWDTKHVYCKQGTVQIETCKFDDESCPFPSHCSICDKFKDDKDDSHALCKGQVDFDSLMLNIDEKTNTKMRKNIDRFKDLMRKKNNKNFITGIHNYCDGRCHQCDFTDQCSSFDLNAEMAKVSEENNGENSDEKLMVILKATSEFIEEELHKRGIDPVETINEISQCDIPMKASKHLLEKQAESYAEKVKRWLDSNQREIESRIAAEQQSIDKYFESITWFQLFIPAKITRALSVLQSKDISSTEEYDSNGSAKIALIGIDESIWAWENLMHSIPQKEDSILNILKHLSKLRSEMEVLFPKAREFKRPGFDTEE